MKTIDLVVPVGTTLLGITGWVVGLIYNILPLVVIGLLVFYVCLAMLANTVGLPDSSEF